MSPRCETCGKHTELPVHLCGHCAADWNEPGHIGLRRINRRRKANGMTELKFDGDSVVEVTEPR